MLLRWLLDTANAQNKMEIKFPDHVDEDEEIV